MYILELKWDYWYFVKPFKEKNTNFLPHKTTILWMLCSIVWIERDEYKTEYESLSSQLNIWFLNKSENFNIYKSSFNFINYQKLGWSYKDYKILKNLKTQNSLPTIFDYCVEIDLKIFLKSENEKLNILLEKALNFLNDWKQVYPIWLWKKALKPNYLNLSKEENSYSYDTIIEKDEIVMWNVFPKDLYIKNSSFESNWNYWRIFWWIEKEKIEKKIKILNDKNKYFVKENMIIEYNIDNDWDKYSNTKDIYLTTFNREEILKNLNTILETKYYFSKENELIFFL